MATRLPLQQILQWIVIAPRDVHSRYEVCKLLDSKVKQVCLCCHGNKMSTATTHNMDAVASRDLCTTYKLHLPSNSKDMIICLCCHGNKVSKATSHRMDNCSGWPHF